MEVILAVVQPKQNNVYTQEYRPKLYNILLLDHRTTSSGEKGKPTKYLPTFPLTNLQEEAGDEVLANLYQLTGGDHVGIKGRVAAWITMINHRHCSIQITDKKISWLGLQKNTRENSGLEWL